MDKLTAACDEYLAYVLGEDYNEGGTTLPKLETEIFECAMMLCLGENIFDTINAAIDRHEQQEKET